MEGPGNNNGFNNPTGRPGYPWNTTPNFNEHDRERLKQEFLQPFNEEQVLEEYSTAIKLPYDSELEDSLFQLYSRHIGEFQYRILDLKSKKGETKDLFFELSRDLSKKAESEFVFRSLDSNGFGKGFNIAHRNIKTQQEGIGGSVFLQKAEEYLRILKKHNLVECEWLAVDSAQPNVTEFFVKNGFRFVGGAHEVHTKYLANPDAYEMVNIDFTDDPMPRDPVPVLKEAFDDPRLAPYVTEENGMKIVRMDFRESEKFEKYVPYVYLAKDL